MDLTPATLLDVWERGQRLPPLERSLLLLDLALPGRNAEELAGTSIGTRDRALTRLRQSLFGSAMGGYVDCPSCGQRLGIDLGLPPIAEPPPSPEQHQFVSRDGLEFRAPDSRDLAAIAEAETVEAAVGGLLRLCCTSPTDRIPSHWSDALVAEVDGGLATIDPDGELCLELSCADCGYSWQTALDPGQFLWEELEAHGVSLLHAVHRLAAAYGWSERDILALPATRRAAYLQLLEP
jgi:hypothetical protein